MSEYPSDWTATNLGSFLKETKQKVGEGSATPYSVSKILGIVPQSEKFKKRVASNDISNYKIIRKDDFAYDPMLLWDGSINRMLREDVGAVSPAYVTFRVDGNLLDSDYLLHLLKAEKTKNFYKSISKGTNVRRQKAEFGDFAAGVFAFPPLLEQKKIAEILSGIDVVINKTLEAIAKTETTLIGIFADLNLIASSGQITILGEAARVQNGYAFQSSTFSENPEDIPLIRISNISGGIVDASKSKRIPRNLAPSVEYQVNKGDVLIAMSGATTGKIGEYQGYDLCLLNQRVGKFIFHQGSESAFYASQLLLSGFLESRILAKAAGGAQPNISGKGIEEIEIPFPDAPDQLKYGNAIQKLLAMNSKRRFIVEKYQQLKEALASDLLSGRKRVSI